jgi:pSer/pThr/pTyr-binding forkhead associated (FHA) protein
MPNLLKVRLSLKGRPLRSFTFNKKTVSIGRDPASDIFLDNTGISRAHARIERTPGGYVIEDLGSANGTFVNDQQVQREYLGHDDVVRIGKFALWMGVESDRRATESSGGPPPNALEGTMILSPDQLLWMQKKAKQEEREGTPESPAPPPPVRRPTLSRPAVVTIVGAAFLLGFFAGAATLLLRLG